MSDYRDYRDYRDHVRNHALLAGIAFLVVIPLGVLIPRYLRTFTNRWWWVHLVINFFVASPLVFASWGMAARANNVLHTPMDHHKKVGYAIFGLYIVQFALGVFIHAVRVPFLFIAHRPPQNYFHAVLGLAILALAAYQIHYGLYDQWPETVGEYLEEPVKDYVKHAWLALVIVFWALYAIGLVFVPRQYQQEREGRLLKQDKEAAS